jgi:hypothetical protein
MAIDDDGMSRAVARCRSLDPYSLWRALKDLENEIYAIKRANEPIPIEMIRMRAVLLRARGKEAGSSASISAPLQSGLPRNCAALKDVGCDVFDFVDRYRALGGLRVAIAWGENVRIFAWNRDSQEAAEFWDRCFPALSHDQQQAVAACLLELGRS